MTDYKPVLVGITIGSAVAAVEYLDGRWFPEVLLSLGVIWTLSGWLLARNSSKLREANKLHSFALILLVTIIPMFGIHPNLPLNGLRTTLILLTIGIGLVGVGLGMEI
ncbi:hypothetical protein GCM10009037_29620 [Halarchaeum grantii]|uniref:Uncharacterized protein n=1 Tax=Halarchaeum grantii TaxID=1193105 RepID=A0A830FE07_9EURY|nr:hypothetical protein [Halarchaeum grantii]GGL44297.1 hypothetical protein GCM10009037_29620 [Halarchaeum grantii]